MRGRLKFARSLFRRLRGVKDPLTLPSLVRALDHLVPRRVMREVVASSHDRRQWGVLAAAWVGVSEREFFDAAAKVMEISLEGRVLPADLTNFGPRSRSIMGELRRVGAMVVVSEGAVVRIVAVDPAEVRSLSFFRPGLPVSLASWSDIARALDASERILTEYEGNTELREAKRRQEICGKILRIILREASAHGATSVEVVTVDGRSRYQFVTFHGRMATGSIRTEVVQDLAQYLCSLESGMLRSDDLGEVLLRSLGSPSNFRLSWGAPAKPETGPVFESSSEPNASLPAQPRPLTISPGYLQEEGPHEQPVLVVDDNPMFCRVLERLLRREGMNPYFADNGVVALEKLESAGGALPKIIICDLHMPVMNGRELLARLKEDSRLKDIPVIMLTSDEDVDAELQLLTGGADAFVSKAKDPRVLTAQVQRLLKRATLREAA
jgi:CheY-like chemotaxis protein